MLCSRPDIARHVQKLHIRFSSSRTTYLADINGIAISQLLRELAPKLDALHTFIWDADEIPQCDEMWFALRMSCVLSMIYHHCQELNFVTGAHGYVQSERVTDLCYPTSTVMYVHDKHSLRSLIFSSCWNSRTSVGSR